MRQELQIGKLAVDMANVVASLFCCICSQEYSAILFTVRNYAFCRENNSIMQITLVGEKWVIPLVKCEKIERSNNNKNAPYLEENFSYLF